MIPWVAEEVREIRDLLLGDLDMIGDPANEGAEGGQSVADALLDGRSKRARVEAEARGRDSLGVYLAAISRIRLLKKEEITY